MSDLERYVKKRKRLDPEFAEGFEVGYSNFKVGVLLRQASEKAGMTQDDVARRLRTKRSAISRIENHAEDIRLSTIHPKVRQSLGQEFESRNHGLRLLTRRTAAGHLLGGSSEVGLRGFRFMRVRIAIRTPDPRFLFHVKVYQVLRPEANDPEGYIRIVDESGEDYLYSAKGFEIIELPARVQRKLRATMR
ncbi:MAG: helix-turn-helix domain-containing protein [Acidobacteriota bacterium]